MLKQHSTGLIATVSDPVKVRELEKSLTISKIVDTAVPMSVVSHNVNPGDLERSLDIQLTRLVQSLNLKWNIEPPQIKLIVEDLIEKYKHEALEDFILIFKKARQNEFGEIYRLDSAVVFGWVDKYLDEKYKVVESKLREEKDTWKNESIRTQSDWLQLWKEAIEKTDAEGGPTRTLSLNLTTLSNVRAMTPSEIEKEGQEKPKFKPYPYTNAEVYQRQLDERTRKGREIWFAENYPGATPKQLKEYLDSFER